MRLIPKDNLEKLRELPSTFKGTWEPLPCNVTGRDRGRSLFQWLGDFPASGLDRWSVAPHVDEKNRMQKDCNASAHTPVCYRKVWSPRPSLSAMWHMNVGYVGPVANVEDVRRVQSEGTSGRGRMDGTFINPKLSL